MKGWINLNNDVMFSSNSNEWSTPQELFDELNKEFDFTLDPCAAHENAKCEKYYTIQDDGLKQSWQGETVFCNPPYGREISQWVEKCYMESLGGGTVVLLIPSRTDTKYWHKWIFGKAEVRFLKGRLKFGQAKNSAPFPSAIVVYKKGGSKMKANEYQKLALRTASSLEPEDLIENGALGLCGESGEVADVVKKWKFQGHKLDKQKIIKELGDVCWYIAITAEGLGVDLETVMQKNIDKLMNRYPEGFKADKSINRIDKDD